MESNDKPKSNILNIPTAIIIAGAIIAGSVLYTNTNENTKKVAKLNSLGFEEQFKAVTVDDHILGNPNAEIKIVEYSDTSCPFCKVFHNTMRKIVADYG